MSEHEVKHQRNHSIDVLRGIGCVYVILGHLRPGFMEIHIYSFHMFLFFFLSGYLFKERATVLVLRKNVHSLLVPFVCAGGGSGYLSSVE